MNGQNIDQYSKFPDEIKKLKNWVCWKIVNLKDSPETRKIPINPITGSAAKSNDTNTWGTFEQSVQALSTYGCQYPGIMFQKGTIWGVDIDHCIHEDGTLSDEAVDIIKTMNSYTELSPSGRGIHIIAYGKKPEGGCRKGNVEMYDTGRGFTVTGNSLGDPLPVRDCTEEALIVHRKYISPAPDYKQKQVKANKTHKSVELSEQTAIDAALRSKVGTKIRALLDGDWSGYKSQSDGDQALCNYLSFFTGKDVGMMDSIFRKSGLYRQKWDELRGDSTYGQITIQTAIEGCSEVYTPRDEVALQRREAAVKAAIAAPVAIRPDGTKEYSTDDTGNAHRLKDSFADKIRYSHPEKLWRVFNGKRWTDDDLGELKRMADQVIDEMANSALPEGAGLFGAMDWAKHLKRTKSSAGKEAMIRETQHLEGIAITPDMLDHDPLLINCLNGTYNLRTGQLQKHNPADMITKLASVIYDSSADCPLWKKCLETIFNGDQELICYFQAAAGYSMTGISREQCMFILYGNGQNGKSTVIETIMTILGDYSMTASPETFMTKDRSGGADPEIVRLKGSRFVSTIEPQEHMKFNEGLIKQMTGNDTITARPLYSKAIQFKPVFKLWMATNHKPVIRGQDDGIWRRIRLIPFTVKIPDDQKDPDLPEKLLEETSGILNWMIEGYNDYTRYGLKPPQAVVDATAEYRSEMDVIASFLDECVQPSFEKFILSADMYHCYKSWCQENGFRGIMNQIKFGRELNKRIQSDRSMNGKRYPGHEFTNQGERLLSRAAINCSKE